MRAMILRMGRLLFCLLLLGSSLPVSALPADAALAMAEGSVGQRAQAISAALQEGHPELEPFLRALRDGEIRITGDGVYRVDGGSDAVDVSTGQRVGLPAGARPVVNNNRMRRTIDAALASFNLFAAHPGVRGRAIESLIASRPDSTLLAVIERADESETDPRLQAQLALLRAVVELQAPDPEVRILAAERVGRSDQPAMIALLTERLAESAEQDAEVRDALQDALNAIQSRLVWGERLGVLFTGISLGSVLVLVALGLAITYGLLGVINMAHGELMMIGAYATWLVQNLFISFWPEAINAYILLAIPASFLAAALVGALIERGVIRWLYGRPLETLLATWGISLILMQLVRSFFGAQNVQVQNSAWLSGGVQVMSNLTLPWNRIAIVAFTLLVLAGVGLLLARTRLGLFVRAVTQNRKMAACTGVDTSRVDTLAFALGSGIAGLAGCALSQLGNVGPELGQGYIVDAFMVVVTGGVGQLAGTVYAGLGLGVINKFLEGWMGAVLAKIALLVLIIIFIQKRPQGLFALKGRSVEN